MVSNMTDGVRVVVTGHDDRGRSVVRDDRQVRRFPVPSAGTNFHLLWGADSLPHFPDDGSADDSVVPFPPVGGIRFVQMVVLPDGKADDATDNVENVHLAEGERPGMHTTASVDCCVVIEGEVWLELSDGVELHLKQGDSVVQNGTMHGWRNHTDQVARVGVFLVGTEHDGLAPRA